MCTAIRSYLSRQERNSSETGQQNVGRLLNDLQLLRCARIADCNKRFKIFTFKHFPSLKHIYFYLFRSVSPRYDFYSILIQPPVKKPNFFHFPLFKRSLNNSVCSSLAKSQHTSYVQRCVNYWLVVSISCCRLSVPKQINTSSLKLTVVAPSSARKFARWIGITDASDMSTRKRTLMTHLLRISVKLNWWCDNSTRQLHRFARGRSTEATKVLA